MNANRKKAWSLKLNLATDGLGTLGVPTSTFQRLCEASSSTSNVSEEFICFATWAAEEDDSMELAAQSAANRGGLVWELREMELQWKSLRKVIEFLFGEKELRPRNGAKTCEMWAIVEEEEEEDEEKYSIFEKTGAD